MWPWLRDSWRQFWFDKAYFTGLWDKWVAKVRAVIMAAGASLAFYDDQIEAAAPEALRGKVRLAGVTIMAVSLMLRAGDKTPAEVKQFVADFGKRVGP